jgi:hypothetical protein
MNPARRGNAAAFSMAIKESLFPKLKFLQGTNASLDFSMETHPFVGICVIAVVYLKLMPTSGGMTTAGW